MNVVVSASTVVPTVGYRHLSESDVLHSAVMSRKAFVREVLCATSNGKERSQWLLPDGSCAAALWIQGTVVVPEDQTGFLTLDDGYENCAVALCTYAVGSLCARWQLWRHSGACETHIRDTP